MSLQMKVRPVRVGGSCQDDEMMQTYVVWNGVCDVSTIWCLMQM